MQEQVWGSHDRKLVQVSQIWVQCTLALPMKSYPFHIHADNKHDFGTYEQMLISHTLLQVMSMHHTNGLKTGCGAALECESMSGTKRVVLWAAGATPAEVACSASPTWLHMVVLAIV